MRLSRRFRHSYFPRHFALCLPKTPSTDHQRTKPCSVPSCLRSNLERRCSFHKKGISHSKRAHGSFCIPTRAFAGQSSIRQLCASKGDAGRRLSESRSPDERRKLDRSADGRIFFERQMRTASFVQVNNQIPIVRSHERSIICGIRGVGVRSGFTEKL